MCDHLIGTRRYAVKLLEKQCTANLNLIELFHWLVLSSTGLVKQQKSWLEFYSRYLYCLKKCYEDDNGLTKFCSKWCKIFEVYM